MKPREKLLERGIDSLTDVEIVSVLIGTGCKGRDYRKVSTDIVRYLGHLESIKPKKISVAELVNIHGVGHRKALVILAALELAYRFDPSLHGFKTKLSTRKDVAAYMSYISRNKQENLFVLGLNTRYELIGKKLIALGSMDKVNVSIRDIVRFALEKNVYGLILAHNHPSGDPSPSPQDLNVTQKIKEACRIMDIELIDHVIIADQGWKGIDL